MPQKLAEHMRYTFWQISLPSPLQNDNVKCSNSGFCEDGENNDKFPNFPLPI